MEFHDIDKLLALCYNICKHFRDIPRLKAEYPGIETVFVTPYLTVSNQRQINELLHFDLYDTVLYPPLERVPPRFSISKRNEWMMSQADLIIAYVDHNYGGAYKSLQVAKRKSKRIINIFTLLNS